jgi:hypothetical protein
MTAADRNPPRDQHHRPRHRRRHPKIQRRVIGYWPNVDPGLGANIAAGLGLGLGAGAGDGGASALEQVTAEPRR